MVVPQVAAWFERGLPAVARRPGVAAVCYGAVGVLGLAGTILVSILAVLMLMEG